MHGYAKGASTGGLYVKSGNCRRVFKADKDNGAPVLDGMVVAVSALIKFIGQKKQKPAIYVFTDAQTPISTGEDDASSMDAIQNQCKKAGIELKFLYV